MAAVGPAMSLVRTRLKPRTTLCRGVPQAVVRPFRVVPHPQEAKVPISKSILDGVGASHYIVSWLCPKL